MRGLFITGVIFMLLPAAFFTPFTGVLLWSWVSFMSPQRLAWGITDSIPFALIIGLIGIAGWLLNEHRRLPRDATMLLLGAFVVMITISTYFALVPDLAWPKWWETTKALIYVFVTAALLTNRVRVHALLWIMVIAIGYYGVKGGLFTLLTGGASTIYGPPETMIGDNNQLAVAMVVTLPLMNYLGRQSRQPALRFALRAAMVLTIMAVLGSYSRGAFLALGAMLPFLWVNSKHKLGVALGLGLTVVLALNFMPQKYIDRIHTIETYQNDPSATGRLDIWAAATKIALARPLTGGGFMAPYNQKIVTHYAPGTKARAVHSIWFEILGENGFIALGLWIALAVVAIRNCRYISRLTRDRPDLRWANDVAQMSLVALAGFYVGGSFLSLSYWDFYYTLIVVVASTRRIADAELAVRAPVPAEVEEPAFALPQPR